MGRVKGSLVLFLFLSVAGMLQAARKNAAAIIQENKTENLYNYLCARAFDASVREDYTLAFEYYRKAYQVYPYDGDAPFRLASYYRSLNNIPKALEMAQAAVCQDSLNVNYIVLLSLLYYDTHQEEKTIQILESAVNIASSTEEKLRLLDMILRIYSDKSSFPEMLETLIRIEELEGETIEGLMQRASIYGTIGNVDSTKQCIERLIVLDPSVEDEFLAMLAETYWNHGMNNEAAEIYSDISDRFPHSLNGRLSMIDFYSARHDQNNFTLTFISLVTDKTIDMEIRSSLLENLLALNTALWGDALTFVKQIFKSYFTCEPEDIATMNNFAYSMSLTDTTDLEYYLSLSEKTVKAEPQNFIYLDTYAWIAYLLGRNSVAKRYIDAALQYSAGMTSVELLDHAGDIYFKSGLKDKACEFWTKAIDALYSMKTGGVNRSTLDSLQQKIRNCRK